MSRLLTTMMDIPDCIHDGTFTETQERKTFPNHKHDYIEVRRKCDMCLDLLFEEHKNPVTGSVHVYYEDPTYSMLWTRSGRNSLIARLLDCHGWPVPRQWEGWDDEG